MTVGQKLGAGKCQASGNMLTFPMTRQLLLRWRSASFLQDFLAFLLRVVAGGQNSSQASSGTITAAQTKGSSGRNSRRCRDPDWVGRSGKTSWFSFHLCCGSDPRFVCVDEARPHPPQLIGRTKNGRVIKELIFRRLGQSGVSTPEPVGLLHK